MNLHVIVLQKRLLNIVILPCSVYQRRVEPLEDTLFHHTQDTPQFPSCLWIRSWWLRSSGTVLGCLCFHFVWQVCDCCFCFHESYFEVLQEWDIGRAIKQGPEIWIPMKYDLHMICWNSLKYTIVTFLAGDRYKIYHKSTCRHSWMVFTLMLEWLI